MSHMLSSDYEKSFVFLSKSAAADNAVYCLEQCFSTFVKPRPGKFFFY